MEAEVKDVYRWEVQLGRRQSFARSGCPAFTLCGSVESLLEKEGVTLFSEDHLLVAKLKVRFYALLHSTQSSPHMLMHESRRTRMKYR